MGRLERIAKTHMVYALSAITVVGCPGVFGRLERVNNRAWFMVSLHHSIGYLSVSGGLERAKKRVRFTVSLPSQCWIHLKLGSP